MGTITRERFEQGMGYEEFKASMTRNQERFIANEERVRLSKADVDVFRRRPLRVMVLAADWCGDVIANLPVLGIIAKQAGTPDIRVFERDANSDLMDRYLNQGTFKSIPVFAFFDDAWKEVGVFIERPETVTELRAKKRREIFASHPEFGSPDAPVDQLAEDVRARLQHELQKMRDDMAEWANAEVVRELRAIVEGRATRGGAHQTKEG
ncbi:MAG: thioredoxin family protein [Chloroflexi bacterium]|nr:thioredoxin family protein [Chloroflexota bacterium]